MQTGQNEAVQVSLVDISDTTALIRRATCAHVDLGPTIGRLFGEIIAGNPEAELEDAPRVYYRDWTPDHCEIEVALPVGPHVGPAAGTSIKNYPACSALSTEHLGPYDTLHESWLRLYAFAQEEGVQPSGYPWDSYAVGPIDQPDPSLWVTELYLPIG